MAAKVIGEYEKTQAGLKTEKKERDYEAGELVLYKAKILQEDGKFEEALSYLAKNQERICDERALKHQQIDILLAMKELNKAEVIVRGMIDENRENVAYYKQLEACLSLDDASPEEDRVQMYTDVLAKHPKAHT